MDPSLFAYIYTETRHSLPNVCRMSTEKTFHALELQLIKFSLSPGEILVLICNPTSGTHLLSIMGNYLNHISQGQLPHISGLVASYHETPRFKIRKEGLRVWFEILLGHSIVSVKGVCITRAEQEHWEDIVKVTLQEICGSECVAYLGFWFNAFNLRVLIVILLLLYRIPIYQLVSLHLLSLSHESIPELLVENDLSSGRSEPEPDEKHQTPYHVLFTPQTNHVLCNNSCLRHSWRALPRLGTQAWSDQERIEDFVQNFNAMQWLALKVRFVGRLKINNHTGGHRETKTYLVVTENRQHRLGVLKTSPSPLPSKHVSESAHLYGKWHHICKMAPAIGGEVNLTPF